MQFWLPLSDGTRDEVLHSRTTERSKCITLAPNVCSHELPGVGWRNIRNVFYPYFEKYRPLYNLFLARGSYTRRTFLIDSLTEVLCWWPRLSGSSFISICISKISRQHLVTDIPPCSGALIRCTGSIRLLLNLFLTQWVTWVLHTCAQRRSKRWYGCGGCGLVEMAHTGYHVVVDLVAKCECGLHTASWVCQTSSL